MRQILAAATCALLMSAPALAESFTPSPPGSMVLDLDTQGGNFSAWRIEDAQAINTIHATLQVDRLGLDPHWAPGFTISFINGTDRVMFRIQSADRKPPLTMRLVMMKNDKTADEQDYLATVGMDEKLELTMTWTADGAVSARAGDEKRTIALGAPVRAVEIAGSTGEVELNPLTIGTTAP